ncbi:MAG: hypothetical protein JNL48_08965 [Acidobacteria bacterium]|nr:hypothetical protein [Acidobacteriota bacterium]
MRLLEGVGRQLADAARAVVLRGDTHAELLARRQDLVHVGEIGVDDHGIDRGREGRVPELHPVPQHPAQVVVVRGGITQAVDIGINRRGVAVEPGQRRSVEFDHDLQTASGH